jgi:hypothetical protein
MRFEALSRNNSFDMLIEMQMFIDNFFFLVFRFWRKRLCKRSVSSNLRLCFLAQCFDLLLTIFGCQGDLYLAPGTHLFIIERII